MVIESWRAQYPGLPLSGAADDNGARGHSLPEDAAPLDWRNPAGWVACGRRLRSADLVILAVLSPVQVPAYLGILYGLGGKAMTVALCHNVLPHERKPYDRPLMKALLNRVDAVLTHSGEQAAWRRP